MPSVLDDGLVHLYYNVVTALMTVVCLLAFTNDSQWFICYIVLTKLFAHLPSRAYKLQ